MKIIFRWFLIGVFFIVVQSCSKDTVNNPIVGTWKLIEWNADITFHLNPTQLPNTDFLQHTSCSVDEVLIFDSNGIVTGKDTFNPALTISLKDGTTDKFLIDEICAEGSIGFSTSYIQRNNQTIELNGALGIFENQTLTLVYANAVKIYDQSLSEVLHYNDLTLTYQKQ